MKLIAVHNVKLKDGYCLPGSELTLGKDEAEVMLQAGAVRKPDAEPKRRATVEPPPATGAEKQ